MSRIRPFFYYYGGKYRAAPIDGRIVEPFAGAAGYSTSYHEADVTLYEINPVVCSVWDYIIRSSPSEILSLPATVAHVDELSVCQEAKWLIGFWLNQGTSHSNKQPSTWMKSGLRPLSYWGENVRSMLASQVDCVNHWKVVNASYESCPDAESTWFIDPPYERSGKHYKYRDVDYAKLADFCRSRRGRVVVCEQEGATWLPFRPFAKVKSNSGKRGKVHSHEVVWTRDAGEAGVSVA